MKLLAQVNGAETWSGALVRGLRDFYLFAKLNPGMAMAVLAMVAFIAPKVIRHFDSKTQYSMKDAWKYPTEWMPLLLIVLAGILFAVN